MKWFLTYLAGAAVLLAPVALRVVMRSQPQPKALDEAAVAKGKVLFTHEWTANDPLSASGDGLGPVFNAKSCVACHEQGGVGGSGGNQHNVTTFFKAAGTNGKPVQGVVHAFAINPQHQETLAQVSPGLPPHVRPTLAQIQQLSGPGKQFAFDVQVSQRNTPALFGAKLIDDLPDSVIIAQERLQKVRWHTGGGENVPVGRALRLPDGRVGKFGWKAQSTSLLSFVQAACANELGLGNPGQAQPTPLAVPGYQPKGLDLTQEQCEHMTAFVAALHRPVEKAPLDLQGQASVASGRKHFEAIGCAECHVANIGSIEGIYSDLLLHRMGVELVGGGSYNAPPPGIPESPGHQAQPDEWRTPPLWGVADSAPYLHDGRAATLLDAIRLHAGQARDAAVRFGQLPPDHQQDVINFLKSLRAPG